MYSRIWRKIYDEILPKKLGVAFLRVIK